MPSAVALKQFTECVAANASVTAGASADVTAVLTAIANDAALPVDIITDVTDCADALSKALHTHNPVAVLLGLFGWRAHRVRHIDLLHPALCSIC